MAPRGSPVTDTPEPWSTRLRRSFDGRKTGTSYAATSTVSPVLGLRAVRALRCRTLKVPKPRSSMPSPRASASLTASRKASTTSPHSLLVTRRPIAWATCSTRSAFGHPLLLARSVATSCRFIMITRRATPGATSHRPRRGEAVPGGVGRGRHLSASGRCRPRWATAFLHRTDGAGATRRGGRHGLAHAEPTRCRSRHPKGPGRSRPRPGDPDRQRRSGGRGTTPSRPATCGALNPHAHAAFPCTSTPMSFSHLRIGNGHADPGSKNGLPSRRRTRHRNNRRITAPFRVPNALQRRGRWL